MGEILRIQCNSLPVEEYRDAYNARRGPWGTAPTSDELWDGDRRVFWERELTQEELKEILRFRRLAKYAHMLSNVGFGIKVPMPKTPAIIDELMKLSQESLKSSSGTFNPIVLPPEEELDSSPRPFKVLRSSITTIDDIYANRETKEEKFEFTNPSMKTTPQPTVSTEATTVNDNEKRLSTSQKAAMQNAGKIIKLDSPRLGHPLHKGRSKKARAQKRVAAHSILQPWFVFLYYLVPLWIMSSFYFIPFLRDLYVAYKDQRVIRTAIEIPYFIQQILPSWLHASSPILFGLLAIEATSLVYILMIILSQLTIFLIVRPLILSLSASYSERGAAKD